MTWVKRYTALQDGAGGKTEYSVVFGDEYVCRNIRSESDAQLIACAPDMFAAILLIVPQLKAIQGWFQAANYPERFQVLLAERISDLEKAARRAEEVN